MNKSTTSSFVLIIKRVLGFCFALMLCIGGTHANVNAASNFSIEKEAILSALYEADIASLREAIDLGIVSCEELTDYYLKRISAYNKTYNCFITICDNALEVAGQRDKALADGTATGLLFGIPIVIKDNINLQGYHTTNGHTKTSDQIAAQNAKIVDYLLAEGAVIIAKANMSTDAQSARDSISKAVGQTKNAYNTYLSSAGSSGGSAVSTSLNFTAAALGTDTNSSLRLPAVYAGCVSLRGTFGLIPMDGVTPLNSTRDIPGAITRMVYDQAIMLDALTCGKYQYTDQLNGNVLQGLRIGVMKELSYPVPNRTDRTEANIDPEISAAFTNALEELKAEGVELVEVSMTNIFSLYQATINSNAADKKEALYTAFTNMLAKYNVSAIVFPTYLTTPLRTGIDSDGNSWNVWTQTFINNCAILSPSASLPEISIPIGLHSLGCGISMEIAAPRNQEQLLLNIAYSYELCCNHRTVPTGAPDTYESSNVGTLKQIIDFYKNQSWPQTSPAPTPAPIPTPTQTPTPAPTPAPTQAPIFPTATHTASSKPTQTIAPTRTPPATPIQSGESGKANRIRVMVGIILAVAILLFIIVSKTAPKRRYK